MAGRGAPEDACESSWSVASPCVSYDRFSSILCTADACSCGFQANRAVRLHAHLSQHKGAPT